MPKETIITFDEHSLRRMLQRGSQFGLHYFETRARILQTIKFGKIPHTYTSKIYNICYLYFKDNLCFYVIYEKKEFDTYTLYVVKTIIIKKGRP